MRTGRSLTVFRSLQPGGDVPGPGGVYLVPGGVPDPGGCTWSRGGVPGPGGVYLVPGVYLVRGGYLTRYTPPPHCEQNDKQV